MANKFKFILTLSLTLLLIGFYLYFSKGSYYIDEKTLISLSGFSSTLPFGVITHFFVHVSPTHLIGNLLFLIVFGLFIENNFEKRDYLLILFSSMIISSLAFILLNPGNYLVGASLGIAGLLGATLAFRPLFGLSLLLLVFFLSPLIINPISSFVNSATSQQQVQLQQEKQNLVSQISNLTAENKSTQVVQQKLNTTLDNLNKLEKAKEIAKAPESTSAHLISFAIGFLFVGFFKKKGFWTTEKL
ncbi:Rhomboid family protein [uncultured archaeon]|nr:Rhomboid family protein [uncultured archaeon]